MKRNRFIISLTVLIGVVIMLIGLSKISTARAFETGEVETHKIVAAPGTFDESDQGIELLHDYGAYALYKVPTSVYGSFSASIKEELNVVDYMDQILFDAYPFNTQVDAVELPANLTIENNSDAALHLVQFVGPINDAWLDAVEETGAKLVHYVANNAYIVWADQAARSQLDEMVSSGGFLQFSSPHQPYYKIGASIRERITGSPDQQELVPVVIQIFDHTGKFTSEALIKSKLVESQSAWTPVLAFQNIYGVVRAGDLEMLAQLPDIVWIGERFERELLDEVQDQIMAGNIQSNGTVDGPGYQAWLDGFGFSQTPADYPIVDITDDGIGNGTVSSGDPTFHEGGLLANPTRLAYIGNCTNSSTGAGVDGHGHINTSIVGSHPMGTGFPHEDPNGYNRGLGINPYAQIAGTRIFDPGFDLSSCGGTDTGLIQDSYNNGAQISSNSWGCSGCAGTYDDSSQAYDVGTRDAVLGTSGNQELFIVFAAGNSGPSAATVGTPGNGKNMLTVGASENVRPSDEDGSWTDGCGIGSTGANDWRDVISFSSRGPSPGGRVKPETIGPGTHVQGTASTNGGYTGNSVCDQFRPSGQTTYAASSGTSHSTPAVAGVSSLVWYWLENNPGSLITGDAGQVPTPALLKAYILAHPTYMSGVSANDSLPSNNQGYGIPNMGLMFDNTPKYVVNQSVLLDNSGEAWVWTGSIADPSEPVRIMLNYTDQAGAIGTSPQVNDLNLKVVVNGSTTYNGNVFSGQWSTTGGSPDTLNNYEGVFLPAGTTGSVEITVTGFNIAGDGVPNVGDGTDQDFGLVCYNCTQGSDFTLGVSPSTQTVCTPSDAVFDVTVGSILGYSDSVTLSAQGQPNPPNSAVFSDNAQPAPYTSTLTIGTTGASGGSYSIDVVGVAPTSTHTATIGLELYSAAPGITTLTAPPNGATGVGTSPTFEWTAVVDAVQYTLEVADDPGFSNVVYSTTVAGTSHMAGSALNPDTLYFWRVTAENACGSGAVSSTWTFRTANLICSASPFAIPDNTPGGVTDSLVLGSGGTLQDLNVLLDVSHTYVGDLFISLEHDDTGTTVTLFDRPGVPASTFGCSDNDINSGLADDEGTDILDIENHCSGSPWINSQSFVPTNALSSFDGENLSGSWTLLVSDNAGADTGTVDQWCLVPATDGGGPTDPIIDVEPDSLASTQDPDTVITDTLTIWNLGGTDLNWTVTETPSSCAAPADIPWLSISPSAGTTISNTNTMLDATFDSTGLSGGVYTSTLCVDSNDPVTPLVEVPVTMTVNDPPVWYNYMPLMRNE